MIIALEFYTIVGGIYYLGYLGGMNDHTPNRSFALTTAFCGPVAWALMAVAVIWIHLFEQKEPRQ